MYIYMCVYTSSIFGIHVKYNNRPVIERNYAQAIGKFLCSIIQGLCM